MADLGGGFAKKRHRIAVAWRVWDGGRHSHGGRGGYGGVAENGGICLVFVRGRSWANPTQPYPVMHSIKCCPTPHLTSPLRPSLTSASFPHPAAPSRRRDRRHPHSPRTQPPPPATPLHEDEGQLRASPGNAASRDRDTSSFCLVKKTKKTKTQTRVSQP